MVEPGHCPDAVGGGDHRARAAGQEQHLDLGVFMRREVNGAPLQQQPVRRLPGQCVAHLHQVFVAIDGEGLQRPPARAGLDAHDAGLARRAAKTPAAPPRIGNSNALFPARGPCRQGTRHASRTVTHCTENKWTLTGIERDSARLEWASRFSPWRKSLWVGSDWPGSEPSQSPDGNHGEDVVERSTPYRSSPSCDRPKGFFARAKTGMPIPGERCRAWS